MPDWKREILSRLNDPVLARQPDVIEELAEHVEQRYRALIAKGRSESDAATEALDELSDPVALARELRRIIPDRPTRPRSHPHDDGAFSVRCGRICGTGHACCAGIQASPPLPSWRSRSAPAPTPPSSPSSTP